MTAVYTVRRRAARRQEGEEAEEAETEEMARLRAQLEREALDDREEAEAAVRVS